MLRTIIVTTLLIAGGCAQQVWYRENTTLSEARRDLAECKYEAIKSTPPYRGLENPIAAGMEAKGYRLVDPSSGLRMTDP